MFWDKVAALYDFFENVYNGKVYKGLAEEVAGLIELDDNVLECACGTGMISRSIAPRCRQLTATDFSEGMLKQARKHCAQFDNVTVCHANIMELDYEAETFDKVVAGNVIHLLDNPHRAIQELNRVCKSGGTIIIPTYINKKENGKPNLGARLLTKLGVQFKRQFGIETYRAFFEQIGYSETEYRIVEGRMPCAIAIIKKTDTNL